MQDRSNSPSQPMNDRLQPFLDYLAATPVKALLNDYTFSLLYLGNDEAEHQERLYQLSERVKKFVSWTDFDVWLADCVNRRKADPDGFFDNAATERDKAQQRGKYAAHALTGVQSENVKWLVPGIVPRGEITIVGADGGTGKGLYTAQMIAYVTTGKCTGFFPEPIDTTGNVLIFAGEDDPSSVLRPRLLAAGADISKVSFVTADGYYMDTGAMLDIHEAGMMQIIERANPALVVVDPLQQFLASNVNMSSRNEMRAAVTPIRSMARQMGFAVVFVLHTNKKAQVAGRARLADSSDLWDMARSVLMLGSSKNDGKVYVSHEKASYSAQAETVLFTKESTTVEGVRTGKAVFDSTTDKKDADFVFETRVRIAQTKEDASAAIMNALAESSTASMACAQLKSEIMKETGCSEHTYKRAYADLVKSGQIAKYQLNQKGGVRGWFTRLAYCGEAEGTETDI